MPELSCEATALSSPPKMPSSYIYVAALLVVLTAVSGLEELKIEVLTPPAKGCRQAVDGDKLKVMYEGKLSDGTQFDSSYERKQPLPVTLGNGMLVAGFETGLKGLCVGEVRKLTIPPHLGYGDRGAGGAIPPGATIVFKGRLQPLLFGSVWGHGWLGFVDLTNCFVCFVFWISSGATF